MQLRRIPLFILFFTITALSAQVNSPYSRYGLGNIFPTTFGASSGMAGFSATYFTPTNINYQNPASYGELGFATFDVGAYGNVITLEDDVERFTSGDGNLSYLAFGFPILKKSRNHKLGMSFGLIPYSAFQYDIIEEQPTDDPLLGTIEYNYVGNGKLYQFYGGLGYKFTTDTVQRTKEIKGDLDTVISTNLFSVGGNAAQVFGSLFNITYASFPDQANSQTTKLTRDNRISGGIYNYGVAYQKQYIRKQASTRDYFVWRFGGSMSPEIGVSGRQSVTWTNIIKIGNFEAVNDTIYAEPDTSGNIIIPASFQGGLSFSFFTTEMENKNQFTIGAQYARTMWSQYEGFQDAGTLGDSWRASVCAEILTKVKKNATTGDKSQRVYNKSPYAIRFGAYTGQSNLIIDGVQLNDRGVTAGIAIPIGVGKEVQATFRNSRLNLFLNAGQRGSNTSITETYYNFGIGVTFIDLNWFQEFKLN